MKNLITTLLLTAFFCQGVSAFTTYPPTLKVNGTHNVNPGGALAITLSSNSVDFDLLYTSNLSYTPLEVFYDFGDGTYGNGTNHTHVYDGAFNGSTVQVKVHTIDDYDEDEDDELPEAIVYTYDISFNLTGAPLPPPLSGSGLSLWNSWSIVPGGETVHYVSEDYRTCSSDAIIGKLVYPTDYFLAGITITVDGNVLPSSAISVNTNVGAGLHEATFTYTQTLPLTTILYSLVTKNTFGRNAGSSCVSLTLLDKQNNVQCSAASSCARSGKSHDPNAKFITAFSNRCDGSSPITIDYIIHYQNIGSAPAKQVTVFDSLDQIADIIDVTYVDSKHSFADTEPAAMAGNLGAVNYLRWYYRYDGVIQSLRGTKEPGYNVDFFEEDTQGWIKFRVTYKHSALLPCNAIMNQARIIFDCNEYFNTKNSYAWNDCPIINSEMACERGCTFYTPPKDETSQYQRTATTTSGKKLIDSPLPPNIVSANWYPESSLDFTNPINPTAHPIENTLYTGVLVDNNCNRYVYHIRVEKKYQLDNNFRGYETGGQYIVIGGSPPYSWSNNAGFTGNIMPASGAGVTITDHHNCEFIIPASSGGGVAFSLTNLLLVAFTVVLIGIFLFLRFRNNKPRR